MGVAGFTPFLQKTCPAVLRQFPSRLQALEGKRVVIDATLITQRFHFSPSPHPYHHVLGWYRLANELKQSNVSAICVFDGKNRNDAKKLETLRRKATHDLSMKRGTIEEARFQRLHDLKVSMDQLHVLNNQTRQEVVKILKESDFTAGAASAAVLDEEVLEKKSVDTEPIKTEDSAVLAEQKVIEKEVEERLESVDTEPIKTEDSAVLTKQKVIEKEVEERLESVDTEPITTEDSAVLAEQKVIEKEVEERLASVDTEPIKTEDSAVLADQKVIEEVEKRLESVDTEPIKTEDSAVLAEQKVIEKEVEEGLESDSAAIPTTQSPSPAELADTLGSLYLSYKGDMAKLVSISTEPTPLPQQPDVLPEKQFDQPEEPSDKIVTKQQYQLTLQEGKLWNTLCASFDELEIDVPASASTDVVEILGKSLIMATSFHKRNNLPTARTYSESKAILKAMGIPCIDATGTVEAEALASSIVLKGYADYVISEDTDVLVYEAPLVRNITSTVEPLLVISGTEVRAELGLSRDAYIDFVLLLGTDFSQRIKNLGPVRAYDFIKKHGCIEDVLKAIEGQPKFALKVSPEAYLAQVQIARLVFTTLPSVPAEEQMKPREENDAEVKRLLHKYELNRFVWDDLSSEAALKGNVFHDNPFAA